MICSASIAVGNAAGNDARQARPFPDTRLTMVIQPVDCDSLAPTALAIRIQDQTILTTALDSGAVGRRPDSGLREPAPQR